MQIPKTKSRSISINCGGFWSNLYQEFFWIIFSKQVNFLWSSWPKKCKKFKKKWIKRQKCIDITLRKWSWRPLWQVGKKSFWRFHSPTGELFEGFAIFPHLSTCLGGVEKSQNPKSFSKIWLWKRQSFGVIFSEFWYFFLQKIGKNTKKL